MDTLALVTWVLFLCASILGVLALSVDYFLTVYLHLRYQEGVTPKRDVSISILFLAIGIIFSLSWITGEHHDFLWIFKFNYVFFATCLIKITFLQCKNYSIVRRHRFIIKIHSQQGSKQNGDETSATPHIPFTFDRLFAKDIQ